MSCAKQVFWSIENTLRIAQEGPMDSCGSRPEVHLIAGGTGGGTEYRCAGLQKGLQIHPGLLISV